MDASRLKINFVAVDHNCLQKWSHVGYPSVIFGSLYLSCIRYKYMVYKYVHMYIYIYTHPMAN